jgi:hypothetical protein
MCWDLATFSASYSRSSVGREALRPARARSSSKLAEVKRKMTSPSPDQSKRYLAPRMVLSVTYNFDGGDALFEAKIDAVLFLVMGLGFALLIASRRADGFFI